MSDEDDLPFQGGENLGCEAVQVYRVDKDRVPMLVDPVNKLGMLVIYSIGSI